MVCLSPLERSPPLKFLKTEYNFFMYELQGAEMKAAKKMRTRRGYQDPIVILT
jgi:hypothetical protein